MKPDDPQLVKQLEHNLRESANCPNPDTRKAFQTERFRLYEARGKIATGTADELIRRYP